MLKDIIGKANELIYNNIHVNEKETINSLILPFFQYLNYNPWDYSEFIPEYKFIGGRIDFVVIRNDTPSILIEVKKIGKNLDYYIAQIEGYMRGVPEAIIGILTNGVEYRFFARTSERIKNFWSFNILNLSDYEINILSKCKSDISFLCNSDLQRELEVSAMLKELITINSRHIVTSIRITNKNSKYITTTEVEEVFKRMLSLSGEGIGKSIVDTELSFEVEKVIELYRAKFFTSETIDWLVMIFKKYKVELFNDIEQYIKVNELNICKDKITNNYILYLTKGLHPFIFIENCLLINENAISEVFNKIFSDLENKRKKAEQLKEDRLKKIERKKNYCDSFCIGEDEDDLI